VTRASRRPKEFCEISIAGYEKGVITCTDLWWRACNCTISLGTSQSSAAELVQAIPCAKDIDPYAEIDDHGKEDTYPNQHVVGVDAQWVPIIGYPTPKLKSLGQQRHARVGLAFVSHDDLHRHFRIPDPYPVLGAVSRSRQL
jgi:hypothetical protein